MSELTARLAIYGAIDVAVLDERLPAEEAARYLPPYGSIVPEAGGHDLLEGAVRSGPATGWYAALGDVVADTDGESGWVQPEALDPGSAIVEMASLPLEDPIVAEHRLRALFLARRLLPEEIVDSDDAFVSALEGVVTADVGPPIEDPSAAARTIAEMMADVEQFPAGDGYVRLAAMAQAEGTLSAPVAEIAATACAEATAWFTVPGTTDDDLAAVVTSTINVTTDACSVADLRLRFHPGRWPHCLPSFWGAMDPLAPPAPHLPSPTVDPGDQLFVYREHVGDQANGSQWFSPVLEFWYDEIEGGPAGNRVVDGFALHYGMATTLPPGVAQDQRILLDDGEMTVRRSNVANGTMGVAATTYKKLAMRQPLPSAGLAIFACVSGWADQAKALVTGCLLNA